MITLVALIAVGAFLVAFFKLGVVGVALGAIAKMRDTMVVIRDPAIDDAGREKAAQGASLQLFGSLGSIVARSLLALAVAAVPVLLADLVGLAPHAAVTEFLSRWDVIVGLSILITVGWIVGRRLRSST